MAYPEMQVDDLKKVSSLPTSQEIATYKLESLQIQALYLAQDFRKAWDLLNQVSGSSLDRSPASLQSGVSLENIQENLRNRFSREGK